MKQFLLIAILLLFSFSIASVVLADVSPAVNKIDEAFKDTIVTANGADPDIAVHALLGNIIKTLLGIMGSVALCIFIYGGIMWMTAGGTEQTITKSQNTMIWAALGLFAVFCSYMIIKFLIKSLAF